MKKAFFYVLTLIVILGLFGGFYWYTNDISESPAVNDQTENDDTPIIHTYYDTPAAIEWDVSWDKIQFKSISKSWFYKKQDDKWYPAVEQTRTIEGKNTIDNNEETLSFTVDYEPDDVNVKIYDKENKLILEKSLVAFSIPFIEEQGDYTYVVEITWKDSDNPYKGSYIYSFDLTVEYPVYFEFSKQDIVQGDIMEVRAYNVNDDQVPFLKQSLFDKFNFFKQDDIYVGYIPTGYFTVPDTYDILYGIEGEELTEKTITVKERDFHIQYLYIDEGVATSTRNEAAYAENAKYFVPVRQSSSPELYYTESFIIPTKGRLTTEFGETRHVNDAPTSYRHSGLDIAAPLGTPVYAVNRGKVVLSMDMILTGKTIVIDHGQGLFSVYFHLDTLLVQEGTMAKRGEQIGTVGTTGFSTGPHLHLTMSYYNVNLEPGYFLVGEPITYSNYAKYLE